MSAFRDFVFFSREMKNCFSTSSCSLLLQIRADTRHNGHAGIRARWKAAETRNNGHGGIGALRGRRRTHVIIDTAALELCVGKL